MGYVRLKLIKGQNYGYWVESVWTSKGPRQKVKGYLGKVIELTKTQERSLSEFVQEPFDTTFKSMPRKDALTNIIRWHLGNYGFVKEDGHLGHPERCRYDVKRNIFVDEKGKGQNLVLKSNDGYFCEKTIGLLFTFKEQGFEREVGVKLAKAFVLAGIDIPKDFFIAYFNRYMDEFVERGY